MRRQQPCSAFSLVELSIVLVILGLLIGGILAGRSLIHASELRTITTEYSKFYTATTAFREKYFYLPGDMPNATQIWGAADVPMWCSMASAPPRTCDGNGNGRLDLGEPGRAMQQLGNAGLVEVQTDGTTSPVPSKLSPLQWSFGYYASPVGAVQLFAGEYQNILTIWGYANAALSPEDVWNIDTKMDDGKPAAGKIVVTSPALPSSVAFCTDTADRTNMAANYLLTSTDPNCNIVFRRQF